MIDTMGLIFSSNNETNLCELEVIRSVAALPFAGIDTQHSSCLRYPIP